MTPDQIQELYAYTYWAFERVWACIESLTDEQFTQLLDYSVGSIRNHVMHLASAEQRWIKRLGSTPTDQLPRIVYEDYTTKRAAKTKYDQVRTEILAYIHALTRTDLEESVQVHFPLRDVKMTRPRWEFLVHVANHATDHRAQILAMLHTHFEVETVEQDMFFYLEAISGE